MKRSIIAAFLAASLFIAPIAHADTSYVPIGDPYNDLGATITGPQQDPNLGIETYLNGTPTSNILIDTSQVATDTVQYVATDQNGLTSTSTRTVIVEAPLPSVQAGTSTIQVAQIATTTSATSTATQ